MLKRVVEEQHLTHRPGPCLALDSHHSTGRSIRAARHNQPEVELELGVGQPKVWLQPAVGLDGAVPVS